MKKRTIAEFSELLRNKGNILTFVDNNHVITILPPIIMGHQHSFKNSIFVDRIDQDEIIEDTDLFKEWWKSISMFKEQLRLLLFYNVLDKDLQKKGNTTTLSDFLVNIQPKVDYVNKYNLIFEDVNKANIGVTTFEITTKRAENYLHMSRPGKIVQFKDIRVLEPSKKKLLVL